MRLLCTRGTGNRVRKTCLICSRVLDAHSNAEIITCSRSLISCTRIEKPHQTAQQFAHQNRIMPNSLDEAIRKSAVTPKMKVMLGVDDIKGDLQRRMLILSAYETRTLPVCVRYTTPLTGSTTWLDVFGVRTV